MATRQYRHTATGDTLYALIRKPSTNQYWDAINLALESIVVVDYNNYAIALTESPAGSYNYIFTVPATLPAGKYYLDIYKQVDTEPLIDDVVQSTEIIDWDGTAELGLNDIDSIIDAILTDTNMLQTDWVNGGRLDLLLDQVLADTDELELDWKDGGRLDLLLDQVLADTDELQAMFEDVDSTGTETISAGDAMNIMLAIIGGNAVYDSTTKVWTIYGRDGTTVLWRVTISNTVHGNRTVSTMV